jgi:hypothetical protein
MERQDRAGGGGLAEKFSSTPAFADFAHGKLLGTEDQADFLDAPR